MFSKRKFSIIGLALALAMFAAGCKKKVPAPALPLRRPRWSSRRRRQPAAPTVAQFTAEPTSIQRGQSSTLRWEVTGACHQRFHRPGDRHRAEHRQPPRQPERFHHLYPDGHRSGRIHHGLGHGQRVRAAPAPAATAAVEPDGLDRTAHRRPTSRTPTSTTTRPTFAAMPATSSPGMPRPSRASSPTSPTRPSSSKAIATNAAPPSTTSAWATAAPVPPRSSSRDSAFPPTG